MVPLETASVRFDRNGVLTVLPEDEVQAVVPSPVRMVRNTGTVQLSSETVIVTGEDLATEASLLADALETVLGARPAIVSEVPTSGPAVVLEIAPVSGGEEAYTLQTLPPDRVQIQANAPAGIFYGAQTLRALVPIQAYASPSGAVDLPAVQVEDEPRFAYRGLHLDVARNFHTAASVKKVLDLMAFYKLNKFHFHVSDDEGWRFAIPSLPELTAVGGRRGHSTDESDRILPAFGSGPDPDAPGSHGTGWYSRDAFIDLLRYAHARHIEVIPEIDMPGHARAAIKSMEARASRLIAAGDPDGAAEYRLVDPEDASVYMSVQGWKDNVVDVCLPSTYRFLETVVDDMAAMYAEAGAPLRVVHVGGDEVPSGVWAGSPACDALRTEQPGLTGQADLFAYFVRRFSDILSARGLVTAGWEEIAARHPESGPVMPDLQAVDRGYRPHVWNSVWGWGGEELAYQLANAGYEVVLSNVSNLYFDLAYTKDPEEPGYYWGGFVDTYAPWSFIPLDLYKNAAADLLGRPIPEDRFSNATRLTPAGRQRIIGIQGQLWAENAKGPEVLEYLLFPKMIGLSERAWAADPAWASIAERTPREEAMARAWNRFASALGRRELPRLDYLGGGVLYRVPPPGARVIDGQVEANVAYPGLQIRFTVDGSEPRAQSTPYESPIDARGTVKLRTFTATGRGSRTVSIETD